MTANKTHPFFARAYDSESPREIMSLYDDWAEDYDAVITKHGYITPQRCAAALAQLEPDRNSAIFDIGCGTGISGLALKAEGFTNLTGSDVNARMLEILAAREQKQGAIYASTHLTRADAPFAIPSGAPIPRHITAMGVIATGHAPAGIIREILGKLGQGGLLVFSLNDHTLEDEPYPETLQAVQAEGIAECILDEYGDHLPAIGLNARILALRKL